MAVIANDGVAVSMALSVPSKGLLDGIDAASVDYPDDMAPDLENVRLSGGTWATRPGYAAYKVLSGSGSVRWLTDLYQSSGAITRYAAQGNGAAAQLYELKEGSDVNFVASTGGASLGGTSQNLFQGVIHADQLYFTDRAGALRKTRPTNYTPAGVHTIVVAQPAAPTAAPLCTPQPFNAHQLDWGGGAWSDSNAGTFGDSDDTTGNPPPAPAFQTRLFTVTGAAAKGETITHATPLTNLNSHTLAFWVRENPLTAPSLGIQFDFGLLSPTDYGVKLRDNTQVANEWYPIFLDVGDIQSANYVRFRVLQGAAASFWVTNILQPGRLEGEYRWIYTHYDPVNGRESQPSAVSNGGQPLDFSATGESWKPTTQKAFSKSCALRFTSDSGVDSSTTRMRVYRSGGVASLTIDADGRDLWLRVAEIPDFASTLTQLENAGSGLLHLASAAGLATGDVVVVEPGTVGKEEYFTITGIAGAVLNVTSPNGGANGVSKYSHANGSTVRIAYIDNVANEQIDLTTPVDLRRDDPPTGVRCLAKAPDGRLWLFNYSGKPTGIAISNHPTPDRPNDFEVFPDGVDPLTTGSATQGFRVQVTGAIAADEEIMCGLFYNGWPTFLTRRALYVVQAHSMSEWSPTSIQKLHNTGAINGDCVQEVNGVLMWVADGPRVMRWTGSGEPENISDLRISSTLKAAPQAYWGQWLAKTSTVQDGHIYRLWITPAGQTQNTLRLDYNIDRQAWESTVYYDASSNAIAYQAASVRAGNVDSPDLYAVDTAGNVIQTETGLLDGTAPIRVRFKTARIPMRGAFLATSLLHSVLIRLAGVTDSATLQILTGGSEYGDQTQSYALDLSGPGDHEVKLRCGERTLVGRWVQLVLTGSFVNRPSFRVLSLKWIPWRTDRITV